MRYPMAIPSLCVLLCSCATSYPRFNPQVIAVTAHTDNQLCTSQDEAFVAYRDTQGQTVVADAKTGAELWRDAGTLAYCGASGVVLADQTSLHRDQAPGAAPDERRVGIRVVVRGYRPGRALLKRVVTIRSCPENQFAFSPWPRGAWVGLEWNAHLRWGAAYPPDDRFERRATRCRGRGAFWIHRQRREVETLRLEERPFDAVSAEKIRARRRSRRLVVAIEQTPVAGKTDSCGAPLKKLTLVARWKGAAIWSKSFGFSESECRP